MAKKTVDQWESWIETVALMNVYVKKQQVPSTRATSIEQAKAMRNELQIRSITQGR